MNKIYLLTYEESNSGITHTLHAFSNPNSARLYMYDHAHKYNYDVRETPIAASNCKDMWLYEVLSSNEPIGDYYLLEEYAVLE